MQVYSAAQLATQASDGSLEVAARMLARLGFSVRLSSSAGGSLRSLKHSFITATRNTTLRGEASACQPCISCTLVGFDQTCCIVVVPPHHRLTRLHSSICRRAG
jgi:hypothetical protein